MRTCSLELPKALLAAGGIPSAAAPQLVYAFPSLLSCPFKSIPSQFLILLNVPPFPPLLSLQKHSLSVPHSFECSSLPSFPVPSNGDPFSVPHTSECSSLPSFPVPSNGDPLSVPNTALVTESQGTAFSSAHRAGQSD